MLTLYEEMLKRHRARVEVFIHAAGCRGVAHPNQVSEGDVLAKKPFCLYAYIGKKQVKTFFYKRNFGMTWSCECSQAGEPE